jgi:hypothetical protein
MTATGPGLIAEGARSNGHETETIHMEGREAGGLRGSRLQARSRHPGPV